MIENFLEHLLKSVLTFEFNRSNADLAVLMFVISLLAYSVLTVFWMHLSDEEIAQIERDVVYLVMENAASHNPEIRRKILDTLYRGVPPRLVSEYQENCLRIAQELREKDLKEIPWNQFKKD